MEPVQNFIRSTLLLEVLTTLTILQGTGWKMAALHSFILVMAGS